MISHAYKYFDSHNRDHRGQMVGDCCEWIITHHSVMMAGVPPSGQLKCHSAVL